MITKELLPRQRFRFHGVVWECERQARRTTFARAVSYPWDGVRIQMKRNKEVESVSGTEETP
jgi:hypothetical protein